MEKYAQFQNEIFGKNTYFFKPSDDPVMVNEILEDIFLKQESNQFGNERYCIYFYPGKYDKRIRPKVGFYTQISGLGYHPEDCQLDFMMCEAKWQKRPGNNVALSNFWRGIENLRINDSVMWAVSQATFMRRMIIDGDVYLHDNEGWASGGFMARTRVSGKVDSGPQQQWFSRNCGWKEWTGHGWNMVFAGLMEDSVPDQTWPEKPYTNIDTVLKMQDKPYLVYCEEKGFLICVPGQEENTKGILEADPDKKRYLPISDFYIAKPETDNSDTINEALRSGKHILFTPGIYSISDTIEVLGDNQILLGTGLASLRSEESCECICKVLGKGCTLAGLLFEVGNRELTSMVKIGEGVTKQISSDNSLNHEVQNREPIQWTVLSDVFFRIGGAVDVETNVEHALEIHKDYVIGDNFWIWRADHGTGVGWHKNKAENGLWVTGKNVHLYALMVEHFRKHQVIWDGEDGYMVMFQCETPYDPPSQTEWMSHDGRVEGYAAYVVSPHVERHLAYGIGIYSFHRDAVLNLEHAMEVPKNHQISVEHACIVMLTGNPGISHIINDVGEGVFRSGQRSILLKFPEK